MKSSNLIKVLKDVPEVRLRIITLAWELTGDDGNLDMEKLMFRIKEVKEASEEAKAYTKVTREALVCLSTLARS